MADTNTIFDRNGFDQQQITCSNCGWTGIGSQAHIIDFYGIGNTQQVNCPNCNNSLGILPRKKEPTSGSPGANATSVD